MKVIFKDENNIVINTYGILECPVNEERMKEKCIELFGDNDPCIIHMSYAKKKILLELEEYFRNNTLGKNYLKDIKVKSTICSSERVQMINVEFN